MASVKELFYDIESMFIEGSNPHEIADQLDCPIEYVTEVLLTFGVEPEDFDVAEMPQGDYYGA